jgi:hypothetical protein
MTLGIGWYPAGLGPAGYDPVIPPDAPRGVHPPAALMFDGQTRDFPLDENGFYREVHPVDQKVELALSVSRGAIASVPGIGNKLRTIQRVRKEVAETLARSYIREALADLLASKAIQINNIDIDIDTSVAGRLLFAVTYLNLELAYLSQNKARTITAELAYA